MRRRRWGQLLLGVLLALSLSACGKAVSSRYYVLEATAAPVVPPGGPVVLVARFTVEPPYDQDRIVYRIGPGDVQMRFYPYDRWAVPLDQMLAGLAAAALDGAGGAHFARAAHAAGPALRLDGHLLRLEEVDTQAGPEVRYRLDLTLSSPSGALLHQVRLENSTPAPVKEVPEIVQRMQALLAEDLAQQRQAFAAAVSGAATAP